MYTPQAIGTPNSDCATVVMILGAGELGRELTIALQRFGVEVHAVDRYRGAPAHNVANHSHVLDLMDGDALRELITEVRPHIVV
ncbi:NAD-dependent epimerase/dehydratase family protein, partial [uncultured Corynebacterium sp.]